MKKMLRLLLLSAALAVMLSVGAFAADVSKAGLYDLTTIAGGVTLTAGTGAGENFTAKSAATYKVAVSGDKLVEDAGDKDYYEGADSVKVVVPTANTDQYLVLALSDEKTPNKDNIVYINQDTGVESGSITFYIYPKSWAKKTYSVYLSSTNGAYTKVASVTSYLPRKFGDVDADGGLSSVDALYTLQASVGNKALSELDRWAADVDKDGGLSSVDALYILQASVGNRVLE